MTLSIPIEDRLEMMETFSRFAWYCDFGEADKFASLFTVDGILEAVIPGQSEDFAPGGKSKRFAGREALKEYIRANFPGAFGLPRSSMFHHQFDLLFDDFTGETARTISWALTVVTLDRADVRTSSGPISYMHGRCEDDWVKVDGTWLYKHRRFYPAGYHPTYFDWNAHGQVPAGSLSKDTHP